MDDKEFMGKLDYILGIAPGGNKENLDMTFARIIALGEERERKNHGQRLTLLLKHLHKTTGTQNTTHQAQGQKVGVLISLRQILHYSYRLYNYCTKYLHRIYKSFRS